MKTLEISCSNDNIKEVVVGNTKVSPQKAIVGIITSAINKNPYSKESSALWKSISAKLEGASEESKPVGVELEDDEFKYLEQAFKAGSQAFSMQDRFWLDEVFRILEEAK